MQPYVEFVQGLSLQTEVIPYAEKMYFTYKGFPIEIYAADCDEVNEIFYWAVFAHDEYLGDHFVF